MCVCNIKYYGFECRKKCNPIFVHACIEVHIQTALVYALVRLTERKFNNISIVFVAMT